MSTAGEINANFESAEDRMDNASAAKFLAQARRNNIEADRLSVLLEAEIRSGEEIRFSNRYQHLYPFSTHIDEHTVGQCMDVLTIWSRMAPKCDIEIVLNSPGGDMVFGMALFDFIKRLRADGHKVTITVMGIAASIAAVILQAGTRRVMGKESWVLIHEVSFSAGGRIGEVEDVTGWVRKVGDRIAGIFAERSKLTRAKVMKGWKRKDWWLSSEECLKFGLVDEVV